MTVDLVLQTDEIEPRILLIRRAHDPFAGHWALPGGFVDVANEPDDQGEDLETAARRELAEETSISPELLDAHDVQLVQVAAVGTPFRDPRQRVITILYAGVVPTDLIAHTAPGDDAAEATWVPLASIDRATLAFDHAELLERGLARLSRERVV